MSAAPSPFARSGAVSRRALLAGLSAAALSVTAGRSGPASAQAAPVKLRIGVIPILGAAPIFVADKEGWLKRAGLDATFTIFESGPNMIQALASGTIDVYVAGVAPLIVARSRGIDVRVVTATAVEEMTFVATGRLARHFAPGVSTAEAFRRHRAAAGAPARLATQPAGSVPNTTLQHWLWEVGKVDRADVTVVPMGIDATQQAVLVGAVEGATVREPAVTIIQGRDPGIKLVALGGEMFPGQPGTVVAATGAFLDKHPTQAQGLVDAIVKAVRLIQEEPARAAPHIEAALGKGITDVATIRKALASPASRFVADPRAIVDATAAMQRYQVTLGSLDKELPLDGLFEPGYVLKAAASQ
ncbi:ABC transporter substrate-binding protein [Rhodoplanes sp. TEM]|uniref:ABC transporter substrate-binding protein n=1 Tax=Rhodoplanes tepidamans TaxID=200616 RepID=A0ABT5J5M1_RHOTP|nr:MULTISPECIES: ABC transporter substrate-binding protein [Rhodoplanes]MDC7784947.1 ABC transporter substrate-binding protein [Rhodoplanes tepidamans]MDC7983957.1 ABC transporter substrate-binding protein [Rhodoplanes sp. TEM]MDQ0353824.1 NitT/TauT family transport system substrate-binding protein [Rhodoplanes tepidamans]